MAEKYSEALKRFKELIKKDNNFPNLSKNSHTLPFFYKKTFILYLYHLKFK